MKKIYGLILLAVVAFGCGDDDGPKLTVEQYMTASTNGWVFQSYKVNGVEALNDLYEACELDDATIFTADGKFTVVDGSSKCDPDDPSTIDSGTWTLNSDKTQITITSTTGGELFTLTKFTANDTNLSGEMSGSIGGTTFTVAIIMKKK